MATAALTVLLVFGLVVTLWYVVSSWPAHPFSRNSISSNGLVYAVLLWYLRGLALLILRNWQVRWDGPPDMIASLGILLVIDGIMLTRLVSWYRYRTAFRVEQRRLDAEEAGR